MEPPLLAETRKRRHHQSFPSPYPSSEQQPHREFSQTNQLHQFNHFAGRHYQDDLHSFFQHEHSHLPGMFDSHLSSRFNTDFGRHDGGYCPDTSSHNFPMNPVYIDDCQECCDREDCQGFYCDSDYCTAERCYTEPCTLDDCAAVTTCPASPCVPGPCSQASSVACQTVFCQDEVCSVDTGPCAVEIVDEICCYGPDCTQSYQALPCGSACPTPDCSKPICPDDPCQNIPITPKTLGGYPPASSDPVPPPSKAENSVRQPAEGDNQSATTPSVNINYVTPSTSSVAGTFDLQEPQSTNRQHTPSPAFQQYPITPTSESTHSPDSTIFDGISCLWSDSCGQTFFDPAALQEHLRQSHLNASGLCLWNGCNREVNGLVDHFRSTHIPPSLCTGQHACLWDGCSAVLDDPNALQSHLNDQHIPVANQCKWDTCGILEPTEVDLEKHIRAEHLVPQLEKTCRWQDERGVCGMVFSSALELQTHAKEVHINALRKKTGYYCHWKGCRRSDKPFSQKGKVERHLQTHTGFKSCTCEVCGKEFSAPQALQQHIRTHTGEKPYKCDVCGKEFAQGSAMTMHKRTHTGERPLQCDFPGCGKRFSESSNLSKHRKTHNPVGQHSCPHPGCDRSFHRLDQMKRHVRTHGTFESYG